MVMVARIEKQSAPGAVPRIGATEDDEHILPAIVGEISKGNGVPFLQVPEAAGSCNVLKESALGIAEHAFGHNRGEAGIACAQIKVEPAVIVQIAKIATHGEQHPVEVGGFGNVGESAIVI